MSEIRFRVNGVEFFDFISATVSWSMESLARTFNFTFSDKWLSSGVRDLPFQEGDACTVEIDGEPIIDGYIDEIPISYDATSHTISVSGRSAHGQLIDCSAIYFQSNWRDVDLLKLCNDVTEPFDVACRFDPLTVPPGDLAQTEKFRRWAIDEEETVYDFIARACKLRQVFALSDSARGVVFSRATKQPSGAVLKRGLNILSGSRSGRFPERFSTYIVKSQSAGFDDWHGDNAANKFHTEQDRGVPLYRPLVIVPDGQATKKTLAARAKWERNIRAGRSRRLVYQVQGTQRFGVRGGVWQPNTLVRVDDSFFDVSGTWLIVGVSVNQTDRTVTTLDLLQREAFDPEPPPPPKKPKSAGWSVF